MSGSIQKRNSYKSDGGLNPLIFLPLSLLAIVVAIIMAFALDFAMEIGHYYIFIVPLVAVAPVAGMVILSVYMSHCRNRLLTICLALVAASVTYLGYYHIGMLHIIGWDQWYRVDILPRYTYFFVNNMTTEDPTLPSKSDEELRPNSDLDVFMNWFLFISEFGISLGICIGVGLVYSRTAYSHLYSKWYTRKTSYLPRGTLASLQGNLNPEILSEIISYPEVKGEEKGRATAMSVEYCEPARDSMLRKKEEPCPVYFTMKEGALGKWRIKQVELTPEEIAILSNRFPALAQFVDEERINEMSLS